MNHSLVEILVLYCLLNGSNECIRGGRKRESLWRWNLTVTDEVLSVTCGKVPYASREGILVEEIILRRNKSLKVDVCQLLTKRSLDMLFVFLIHEILIDNGTHQQVLHCIIILLLVINFPGRYYNESPKFHYQCLFTFGKGS